MRKAAILGAGYMGTAMAWPLSDNGFEIHLIGTHLDGEIIQSCKRKNFHPRLKRYLPKNVTHGIHSQRCEFDGCQVDWKKAFSLSKTR